MHDELRVPIASQYKFLCWYSQYYSTLDISMSTLPGIYSKFLGVYKSRDTIFGILVRLKLIIRDMRRETIFHQIIDLFDVIICTIMIDLIMVKTYQRCSSRINSFSCSIKITMIHRILNFSLFRTFFFINYMRYWLYYNQAIY